MDCTIHISNNNRRGTCPTHTSSLRVNGHPISYFAISHVVNDDFTLAARTRHQLVVVGDGHLDQLATLRRRFQNVFLLESENHLLVDNVDQVEVL
jgi:hypothetical protein